MGRASTARSTPCSTSPRRPWSRSNFRHGAASHRWGASGTGRAHRRAAEPGGTHAASPCGRRRTRVPAPAARRRPTGSVASPGVRRDRAHGNHRTAHAHGPIRPCVGSGRIRSATLRVSPVPPHTTLVRMPRPESCGRRRRRSAPDRRACRSGRCKSRLSRGRGIRRRMSRTGAAVQRYRAHTQCAGHTGCAANHSSSRSATSSGLSSGIQCDTPCSVSNRYGPAT